MNAFVTGGSRGIGREIVLKFVKEGCGCAFTYASNKAAAEEVLSAAAALDPKAVVKAYELDVKDSKAIEAVAETAIADFGDIFAVVNNAAVVRNNAAALMSDDEWNEVIRTDLSGPFFVIRSFLMHLLSNKAGRIVNISSLAQGGTSGQVNYAAAKSGLIGLTKTLAREYGVKGITTNIVTVGYVETAMTRDHLSEKLHEIWMKYCPMKRVGEASEIASLVHYLTTPDAGFINGEVIRVSGGLTYVP
ncbi:MAG: SDR family oxidoreductase [Spirochaetales bacterium]|nr:SDR family oxidoreductase [Spirochaetales bacterium]